MSIFRAPQALEIPEIQVRAEFCLKMIRPCIRLHQAKEVEGRWKVEGEAL